MVAAVRWKRAIVYAIISDVKYTERRDDMAHTNFEHLPLALTVAEVAEILSVSKGVVYEMVAREELRSIRVGKQIRISKAALLTYMGETNNQND